ncbi:uncharacterized protein LOC121381830 [Gigantopelta aegis]|uniref:uncharacterized protein LOC121381830 n=1 Tax=Gigantopelta aegis TaxID=1735272 RepID=UPI001B88823B|nr:uncharacterized protein LOC121381830 [Gigantopelta aegis]
MYFDLPQIAIVILTTVQCAAPLECWKCIADNCQDDPQNNYKAYKVTCMERSVCMKVEYSMNTNNSAGILHSVIRTCSAGPCVPVSDEAYKACSSQKKYFIDGCIRRTCCDDKNLCNTVPCTFVSHPLVITAGVIMVSVVTQVINISS